MSVNPVGWKSPRTLSTIELVDIHLLVKSTRPVLRSAPKKIEPCEPRK